MVATTTSRKNIVGDDEMNESTFKCELRGFGLMIIRKIWVITYLVNHHIRIEIWMNNRVIGLKIFKIPLWDVKNLPNVSTCD